LAAARSASAKAAADAVAVAVAQAVGGGAVVVVVTCSLSTPLAGMPGASLLRRRNSTAGKLDRAWHQGSYYYYIIIQPSDKVGARRVG
jgi:hypothetical protein